MPREWLKQGSQYCCTVGWKEWKGYPNSCTKCGSVLLPWHPVPMRVNGKVFLKTQICFKEEEFEINCASTSQGVFIKVFYTVNVVDAETKMLLGGAVWDTYGNNKRYAENPLFWSWWRWKRKSLAARRVEIEEVLGAFPDEVTGSTPRALPSWTRHWRVNTVSLLLNWRGIWLKGGSCAKERALLKYCLLQLEHPFVKQSLGKLHARAVPGCRLCFSCSFTPLSTYTKIPSFSATSKLWTSPSNGGLTAMAGFGCVQAVDEICKYFKTVPNFVGSR